MIISCIGDSLTEGDYGLRGRTGIANLHREGYPYFLSKIMKCEVRNFGKCGYKSSAMLNRYDEGLVCVGGSDIVLIMLGTNGGQDPENDTEENRAYLSLIERVRTDAPESNIVLIVPPNSTENPNYSNCGYMPHVKQAQEFTRKTAAALGLDLIDLSPVFTEKRENVFQANDGLHCNLQGYMMMAQVIALNLFRILKLAPETLKTNVKAELVAHRGLSGLECENTAAAFTAAGNRACYYGIETDIWTTKDGVLVCCHDNSTRRVCQTALPITESTFDELRALRFNDPVSKAPAGHLMLPALEEYIQICKKYNKRCVAELKKDFSREEIARIVETFRKYDYLDSTVFIAFNIANLDLIREILPEQPCQFLLSNPDPLGNWYIETAKLLEERRMDLDVDYLSITPESLTYLHAHGIKVNVWTVDSPATAAYLDDCGVDFITTNILERA